MPDTTSRGYPYPEDLDAIDVAGDIQRLAEAINADVGSVNSSLQSQITAMAAVLNSQVNQISNLAGQIGTLNTRVTSLEERTTILFHAVNPTGIALANAQFTQYQIGSLTLAKYTYDVTLTVTSGIQATGGGKCEMVAGVGASPAANQERAESIHVAGATLTLTHEAKYVLGPGTHLISAWGAATATGGGGGSMGRAIASAVCVPRPL